MRIFFQVYSHEVHITSLKKPNNFLLLRKTATEEVGADSKCVLEDRMIIEVQKH